MTTSRNCSVASKSSIISISVISDQANPALTYYRHLANARAYVKDHFLESIKLVDVAASIGVSASRLSHLYHEKLGITFSDWLTQLRVNHAISLIGNRQLTTLEMAHLSGFSSYRTFHRSFKKVTGTTPSLFRKAYQSQLMAENSKNLS